MGSSSQRIKGQRHWVPASRNDKIVGTGGQIFILEYLSLLWKMRRFIPSNYRTGASFVIIFHCQLPRFGRRGCAGPAFPEQGQIMFGRTNAALPYRPPFTSIMRVQLHTFLVLQYLQYAENTIEPRITSWPQHAMNALA